MPEKTPCEILADLEAKRLDIIMNGATTKTYHRNASGGEREMTNTAPDLNRLDTEIARYRDLCAAYRGERPKRFAIRAG